MTEQERIKSQESKGIHTFTDAQDFLFTRLQDTPKMLFRRGEGIERTKMWLETLGNPQEKFPAIHLAGTSGKGSTSYMISSLLVAAGRQVGTHVSPHVYDIRERLMINLDYVDEQEFTDSVRDMVPKIAAMESAPCGRPSYFEVTNALAMQAFRDHQVDYGVIETGLGGRFDSTNTIQRSDKLAVITRLGLDHTEILGDTIEQIAWQKGGIIPRGGTAIALKPHEGSAEAILKGIAQERETELIIVDPSQYVSHVTPTLRGLEFTYSSPSFHAENLSLATLGEYQLENAAVAIEAAAFAARRDGWELTEEAVRHAFEHIVIPGRAEVREYQGHPVIFDSAHNPQKLQAFFDLVEDLGLHEKPQIIFAAKKGWQASLQTVANAAENVYATEYFNDQPPHLKKFSVRSEDFLEEAKQQGIDNLLGNFDHPFKALQAAIGKARPGQPIIVVGSMYMLGELHDSMN